MDLVVQFFPLSPDDINPKSTWSQFLQLGYLKEYYELIDDFSEEAVEALRDELMGIFGRLQCLPKVTSVSAKSAGKLWMRSRNGMQILTNPIFYKIEQVGKATRATPTELTGGTKATKAAIERSLSQMTGHTAVLDVIDEGRKARKAVKARRERMFDTRKNKRKPPVRNLKAQLKRGTRKKRPTPHADVNSDSEDSPSHVAKPLLAKQKRLQARRPVLPLSDNSSSPPPAPRSQPQSLRCHLSNSDNGDDDAPVVHRGFLNSEDNSSDWGSKEDIGVECGYDLEEYESSWQGDNQSSEEDEEDDMVRGCEMIEDEAEEEDVDDEEEGEEDELDGQEEEDAQDVDMDDAKDFMDVD
jgi:hypothetical protein